jgi:hypothetical protein
MNAGTDVTRAKAFENDRRLSMRAKRSNPWRHVVCLGKCENKFRRPGERRDPYAVPSRSGNLLETFYNNRRTGLWVPAFAGTTKCTDTRSRSRDTECPSFAEYALPSCKKRAQGKPDARCTRGLVCKIVQKHAHEHTGPAEAIRLSLRNGFNAYFRALPGDRACLTPSPRGLRLCPPGWARNTSARLDANH